MSTVAKSCIELKCDCGQLILKSYADGTTKLRAKILLFDGLGGGKAVCRSCGYEHDVPVKLRKAFKKDSGIRHYVLDSSK